MNLTNRASDLRWAIVECQRRHLKDANDRLMSVCALELPALEKIRDSRNGRSGRYAVKLKVRRKRARSA